MIKSSYMSNKFKIIMVLFVVIEAFLLFSLILGNVDFQLLFPHGPIARQERDLIITATVIMLVIVVPVYFSLFFFAIKYREGNKTVDRSEKIKNNRFIQISWWVAPAIIIAIIAAITWKSTYKLDPYRPIVSRIEPIRIQVVALQWKWLFIYPEENIATVNFIQFPRGVPVSFELTSDAPMNSFWIPSLSGQIYAMTGMSTKLHLVADNIGDYPGLAAEINGIGFSGMKFVARSSTQEQYDLWVSEVRRDGKKLTGSYYEKLALPTINEAVAYFYPVEDDLYSNIIMKYMHTGEMKHHHE